MPRKKVRRLRREPPSKAWKELPLEELKEKMFGVPFHFKTGERMNELVYAGRSRLGEVILTLNGHTSAYVAVTGEGESIDLIEEKLLKSLLFGPGRAFNRFKKLTQWTYRSFPMEIPLPLPGFEGIDFRQTRRKIREKTA